jgi:hypothetical protein
LEKQRKTIYENARQPDLVNAEDFHFSKAFSEIITEIF